MHHLRHDDKERRFDSLDDYTSGGGGGNPIWLLVIILALILTLSALHALSENGQLILAWFLTFVLPLGIGFGIGLMSIRDE